MSDDTTQPPPVDPDATAPSPPRLTRPTARVDPSSHGDNPANALARHPVPGEIAARFDMLEVLGKGGMGVVYRARDRELGREVALKRVLTERPLHLEMFKEEARVLAGLEHANVVRLYEYGVAGGAPYLVMELVRGRSLSARLAAGRPALVEAVRIALDVLEGLQAAHAQSIAHLDLKPGNVFLDSSGRGRVADFGLARRVNEPAEAGRVAGTPGYMAPEQWAGRPGLASDMFAFGAMFAEMLTGRKLLAGSTNEVREAASRAAALPPPSRLQPSVPAALDDLVRRALDADPAARPAASEAAATLRAWLDALPGRGAVAGELPPRPYKLLEHFRAADAAIFFGREDETAELVHLLTGDAVRLVVVSGPCGIGKSSLLAAGVMRALDPARHEPLLVVSGPDPAGAVLAALAARAAALKVATVTPGELAVDPSMVVDLCFGITRATRGGLVIQVDQLEELFTQNAPDADAAARFFTLVERLVEAQGLPVKVVLSHRVEFRGELAPLEHRLARHAAHFELGEISKKGLIAAIEGPSRIEAYGFAFEAGLPERLAADILETTAQSQQSALPIAQIVCHQLRERCKGGLIDAALHREFGGASGALQRWVESRLDSAAYAASAGLARRLLKELTLREEGRERYARALDEDELLAVPDRERARAVLERLIADQLVVREATETGARRVRLASEVICPLVDRWALEPDEAERAARALARAARQWDEQGRRADDLLVGATLQLVERELPALPGVTAPERALVAASVSARRWQRFNTLLRVSAVLAVLSGLVWMGFLRPGFVRLESQPAGAEVYSGDVKLGVTPLRWKGQPGAQVLTLRSPRHRDRTITVRVPAGGETGERAVLQPLFRTLSVTSDPSGASVTVRRAGAPAKEAPVAQGVTPFAAPLPEGTYALSVARSGYLTTTLDTLVVEPVAEPLEHTFRLRPNTGLLRVSCPDKGSRLALRDGTGRVLFEAALPMPQPVPIEAGHYQAECTGEGNVSDYFSVSVSRGTTAEYLAYTPAVRTLSEKPVPESDPAYDAEKLPEPLAVDTDGDGRPDIEIVPSETEVFARRPGTTAMLWKRVVKAMRLRMAAADLDGARGDELVLHADYSELIVLSPADGEVHWKASTFSESLSAPVLLDIDGDGLKDIVQASTQASRMSPIGGIQAYRGKTGAVLWSYRLGAGVARFGPVVDQDGDGFPDIQAYGWDHKLHVLSAPWRGTLWVGPHATPLARAQLADEGRTLVLDPFDGTRHAISVADGTLLAKTPLVPSVVPGEPTEARTSPHDTVIDLTGDGKPDRIGVSGHTVNVTDSAGQPVWAWTEPGDGWSELFVAACADIDNDTIPDVFVATCDMANAAPAGSLTCLSGKSGQLLWSREVPGRVPMPAVIEGDHLLLRSHDQSSGPDQVLMMGLSDGRVLRRWTAGHSSVPPYVIRWHGIPALLIDRADPETRELSALELVRLR